MLKRPSWADPSFMVYSSEAIFSIYTTTGAASAIIAAANPRRWAIGFTLPPAIIAQPRVAPNNNPADWGENVLAGLDGTFWTIFERGPLVTMEWYVSGGAGQEIGVYEIETQEV